MKILCPVCGFVPYADGKAIVSRPYGDASYWWLCNCGTPSLHPSVEGCVVPMLLSGSPLDETLPGVLEREARAFAVALEDSYPAELWAAIEATKGA